MIVGVSVFVGIFIVAFMKPVNTHLSIQTAKNPFQHLYKTITTKRYVRAFAATTLLATGGFMLMPFGAAFSVNNLGVKPADLFMLFLVSGIASMIFGPIIGKASDRFGKFNVFLVGSIWTIIMVIVYCNQSFIPLWVVIVLNALMFIGVSSRIISSSALISAVPEPRDRGAFMSINASVQYISGGIAAGIAGLIVFQETKTSPLQNYPILGYVVSVTTFITIIMMYFLNRMVMRPQANKTVVS